MKAIIFDLDGVVVDTAKYHYQAWHKLAEELGFAFGKNQNERLKGVSRMQSLEIVLEVGELTGIGEEKKQELADRKNGYYLEMISGIDQSEILPGVFEFIRRLKKEGYKIALGSASKSGRMILEKLGLADQFDVIVDGNLVERAKPDPQVFIKAAEMMKVPCSECVVIEDAAAGIEAALAGGMKCVGVGDRIILGKANVVVPNTKALLELL